MWSISVISVYNRINQDFFFFLTRGNVNEGTKYQNREFQIDT